MATSATALPSDWSRTVIYSVKPQVDDGAWPAKQSKGETVDVQAGVISDGHDAVAAELIYWYEDEDERVKPMSLKRYPDGNHNNEYTASFEAKKLGWYHYRVRAWVDRFGTWQDEFQRRVEGGQPQSELEVELLEGAELLEEAAREAEGEDREKIQAYVERFEDGDMDAALEDRISILYAEYDPRKGAVESDTYDVIIDPKLAQFGAWYEFFPRSAGDEPGRHATLDDAAKRLPRIKELGFDIAYLPPVHPIGETNRKGKDNAPTAAEGDVGSPWAIGGPKEDGTLGGHKSVHPDLGGIEAFDRFVERADELGLHVALDIAFQASPDHPYIQEHPSWFRQRSDGSIRYAENPPKKYEDVHPLNFESDDWKPLWNELKSVFEFWIDHGVTVFRVDNPHTKPFKFWDWCIADLREKHPEVIFLAEAFAKPKTMYTLAKLGFNNSYTYFAWRNSKEELQEYARELFHTDTVDFFRPNFWPNTPDILTDYLVHGGRNAHEIRFILAATLSSAYGIYGPPFEHVFNHQHEDREEYAQNEKYEVRTWDWHDPNSLQPLIKRVNTIRKEQPALQQMRNIRFHETQNPSLIAYSKWTDDNLILTIVNLDPHNGHSGWVGLPLDELDLPSDRPYRVRDLLGGEQYTWNGTHNFVSLNPYVMPAHILHIER